MRFQKSRRKQCKRILTQTESAGCRGVDCKTARMPEPAQGNANADAECGVNAALRAASERRVRSAECTVILKNEECGMRSEVGGENLPGQTIQVAVGSCGVIALASAGLVSAAWISPGHDLTRASQEVPVGRRSSSSPSSGRIQQRPAPGLYFIGFGEAATQEPLFQRESKFPRPCGDLLRSADF
jgi:hypothetical protein